jgi:uncharacterized surface protein with fasciclin (FAS1) repeats
MRLRYYGIPIFALLTMIVMLGSCSDEWETHFNTQAANKSKLNLFEYIKNQSDLTIFTKMLKTTGYDSIISKAGTFTVWVPNDDALKNITTEQLSDTTFVLQIVRNHITRFSYTTSGVMSKTIRMMDNKLFVLAKEPDGYSFGGKKIIQTESNIATSNGIVYVMGDYLPYRLNLWEYIHNTKGLESLRTYIDSLTTLTIDSLASYKNNNLVSYVYKSTNKALNNLGALNTEDSIYTTILPNNAAWEEAYNRIYPFYNTSENDGGVKTQISNVKWTLIKDLVFRGRIIPPTGLDSLFSTYQRNGFVNPDRLFQNSQQVELSNGLGYVSDQLKSTDRDSWYKEIKIEAEDPFYGGRKVVNYSTSIESSIGTGFIVSKGYYLNLTPTGTNTIANVTFKLPNTLSAKYDIYCVFIPTSILDTANRKPSKVKFTLGYKNSDGIQAAGYIDANNLVQSKPTLGAVFTTNPLLTQPEPMLVASGFQFPFTNLIDPKDPNPAVSTTVSLKIDNAALPSDATANRSLLIDCIILKPVQ